MIRKKPVAAAMLALLFSGMLTNPCATVGQLVLDVKLTFSKNTASFNPPFVASWSGGTIIGDDLVTLPDGTELDNFGFAIFDTFDEFQNAIVGTWTVALNDGVVTFDIDSFELDDFPSIVVTAPTQNEQFLCNEVVNVESDSQAKFDSLGLVIASVVGTSIEFPSTSSFRTILGELDSAEIDIRRTGNLGNDILISNIQGDTDLIPLDPVVSIQIQSQPVTINVVTNPNLGDINGDGTVDLLDVGPLVDGILSGEYLFDGDVNKDLAFDLLDVAPFVELLSSN